MFLIDTDVYFSSWIGLCGIMPIIIIYAQIKINTNFHSDLIDGRILVLSRISFPFIVHIN